MKFFFSFLILLLIFGCNNTKQVYWCGDHPCINKKEKEAYFKKTMIVEIKNLDDKEFKNKSEIERITEQAIVNEKERIINEKKLKKKAKLDEKERIKKEKEIEKEAKLEEKKNLKLEKELAKQAKIERKKRLKDEKKLSKKIKRDEKKLAKKKEPIKNVELGTPIGNIEIKAGKFKDLFEKLTKKDSLRPYPDINDIPN